MPTTQKRPLYYLPVVLFLAVVFGIGAVAVTAAVRSYESIPDLVIKIIAGWAALIAAIFGPFTVVLWVWGRTEAHNKKISGILFALLGLAVMAWLIRYALQVMF